MGNNDDTHNNDNGVQPEKSISDFLKAIGAVLSVVLTISTVLIFILEKPIIAIAVGIIFGVAVSLWAIHTKIIGIMEILVAWIIFVVVLLVIMVVWPSTGKVTGNITIAKAMPYAGKIVELEDANKTVHTSKTDGEGNFIFVGIPFGNYSIYVYGVAVVGGELTAIEALVGGDSVKIPSIPITATLTPSATFTYTPTPILTPTLTPTLTPSPLDCSDSEIVPGIFVQLADESTSSFAGSSDNAKFECEGVYALSNETPPAVRIDYKAISGTFAFFGIGISDGFDVTDFSEICVWVYAEESGQQFDLKLEDANGGNGVLINTTKTTEWDEHCVSLDGYPGVDLSDIKVITLSFNDSFGDTTIWVDDFELKK